MNFTKFTFGNVSFKLQKGDFLCEINLNHFHILFLNRLLYKIFFSSRRLLFSGLLFTALSFPATESNAQAGRFGINAGANFSNITGKNASKNNKIKPGIRAGVMYDIGIADEFVVQPGLSYVQNGTKCA